jgi:hypothetical protein
MFTKAARQAAGSAAVRRNRQADEEAGKEREAGMKRCLHCKRPFGLVRKTIGIFWWTKEFCSKRCAEHYIKERQQQEKRRQFLSYLSRPA